MRQAHFLNKLSMQPCYNDLFVHPSYNDLHETIVFNVVFMFFIYFSKKLDPMRDVYFSNKPTLMMTH
jgi:hypothetical protein